MNQFLSFARFSTKVLLLLVCFSLACTTVTAKKKSITQTRYDTDGMEVGTQGTYLVKVHIYTQNASVSTDEFKFAAVHGVIFKGVSGKGFSSQKPLAKAESEKQHSDFYQAFFDNGDFTSYANVITPNSERVKMSNKEYKISAVVSVSKDELRRALETAGMIRNLNSGF